MDMIDFGNGPEEVPEGFMEFFNKTLDFSMRAMRGLLNDLQDYVNNDNGEMVVLTSYKLDETLGNLTRALMSRYQKAGRELGNRAKYSSEELYKRIETIPTVADPEMTREANELLEWSSKRIEEAMAEAAIKVLRGEE